MFAPASGTSHLIECLIADHRRIEEAASHILEECAHGDGIIALLALAALHLEMERHDGIEENALFPMLGRKLPDLEERLAHVRRQHRVAEHKRCELERTLLAGDDDVAAVQGADELYALLVGNHTTEELVIYGVIDELLARLHSEDSASRE